MRRRVFTMLAGVSLVLFVATVVLWVRSYRRLTSISDADSFSFTHSEPLYWIITGKGHAVLCRQIGRNWEGHELPGFHFVGISFGGTRGTDGSMVWNLVLPLWLIVTCLLVLPFARLEFWRRDRRRYWRESQRLCHVCGYDLRATPDRCPECGTQVRSKEMASP